MYIIFIQLTIIYWLRQRTKKTLQSRPCERTPERKNPAYIHLYSRGSDHCTDICPVEKQTLARRYSAIYIYTFFSSFAINIQVYIQNTQLFIYTCITSLIFHHCAPIYKCIYYESNQHTGHFPSQGRGEFSDKPSEVDGLRPAVPRDSRQSNGIIQIYACCKKYAHFSSVTLGYTPVANRSYKVHESAPPLDELRASLLSNFPRGLGNLHHCGEDNFLFLHLTHCTLRCNERGNSHVYVANSYLLYII